MANVLKQLIEGKLDAEVVKQKLCDGKLQQDFPNDGDPSQPSFRTTEFIPYFLNYIREETSCHFTSDLPVISPKKIKKKRRLPRHRTPTSDNSNDSARSSARGSLFSTPPSGRGNNITTSPIERVPAKNVKKSPNNSTYPIASQHSGNSSDGNERSKVLHVTSTPIKFNLDEDFPPVSSQNVSARKSSTPTRRITPTPAHNRRNSSNLFNSFTFDNSTGSEHSFSTEKLKQRHKHASNSASPKNARRASAKLKLEDFMQQGSRNQKLTRSERENTNSKNQTPSRSREHMSISFMSVDKTNASTSSEMESSLSVLEAVEGNTSNCLDESTEERVVPKRELVTECNVLQRLAEIHSFCILENLVPNIVVEMCFILQLLTVEGKSEQENGRKTAVPQEKPSKHRGDLTTKSPLAVSERPDTRPDNTYQSNSGYLRSIHNCVFYAICVLEKLFRIIKLLDKGTLRLLLDNTRITEYSSSINEELREIYPTISINKVPYSLLKSPLNSVPFKASLDNRNNFLTDQAFYCFKRQRDTFYEVVREWEEQCGKPGWSMEEKLGDKIRYIVQQKPGLSNHAHFARLFQSQLIQMCCYENTLPSFNEGESPEFVGNLFKSNPEKFFRLQQRLVAPQSTTAGPCPSPGFTETEEFFREFIVAAMSPSFNRYLMDSFIVKINELNNLSLDEILDNSMGDITKDDKSSKLHVEFASCLITLRTVAKFLGFLVFSPYHNASDFPKALKDTFLSVRNQVTQQIDIMFFLRKAQDEQRLVLTIPWVIEYLSMMDGVCPFLEYYSEVLNFLHHIYRTTLPRSCSVDMSRNSLMLSVGLGWLFEMPVIPDTIFSKSAEKISDDCVRINSTSTWDKMELVDQHLLYTCCPYLGELRSILAEAVLGKAKRRGYMKKIKPICADTVEASPSSCPLLQTQLEDNFFRNQPEFLKKDVDFVINRIYMNMVQMIKNNVIPSELEQTKLTLIMKDTFSIRNWREVNKEDFKDKHKVLIMKLCNKTGDGVMERISSEVNEDCKSRCFTAVQSLAPYDMDEIVTKTASGIVHQSAMNKLLEWSHQNISVIIDKLVREDMDKMISREQNSSTNTYRVHAEDSDHPFNWFYQQLLDNESEKNTSQSRIEQSDVGEPQRLDNSIEKNAK